MRLTLTSWNHRRKFCLIQQSFFFFFHIYSQEIFKKLGHASTNFALELVGQHGFWEEEKSEGSSLALQRGQRGCLESQVSAHSKWKAWLQPGTTRTGCSVPISSRQTAHSFPMRRSFPVILGSLSSWEGEIPVSETGLAGSAGSEWWLVAYQRRHM